MLSRKQTERYLRHVLLKEVGAQGQQKLLSSRVLVVGAGGLGAPILQYLAAAGVGTIGLCDDDAVSLSNLQRQVIYGQGDVGRPKLEAARDFVARLNSDVTLRLLGKMDEGTAADAFADYDLVVEGVDRFAPRFVMNRAAIGTRTPLLSAAVGRFDGQVALFEPWAGARLPCYRCLVPEAPPPEAQARCEEEGILGAVTGVVGALAAMEALKYLLGVGSRLAGALLVFDGFEGGVRRVALSSDPACPDCSAIDRRA